LGRRSGKKATKKGGWQASKTKVQRKLCAEAKKTSGGGLGKKKGKRKKVLDWENSKRPENSYDAEGAFAKKRQS